MPDTNTHRAAGIAFGSSDVIERPEPPFFGNGRVQYDPFVFGLFLGLVVSLAGGVGAMVGTRAAAALAKRR
jgi:hypothetical protein